MARHPTYLGPKVQIQPAELERYEKSGRYAAEEKHDGHWAEVITDSKGIIVSITGRSGKPFSGNNIEGLIGHQIRLVNTTLIAELEAGTEAATKLYAKTGKRRLHVFDIVKLVGVETTHLSYTERRQLLEHIFSTIIDDERLLLAKQTTKNFKLFFDQIVKNDGEGIVLKRVDRPYKPQNGGGKTEDWIRCKRFRYVDYVVMEIGKSDGGSPNFQVGLFINGKLQRVATIKNIPEGLDYHALVGRIIECKGAEVHESGALRHGHYERTRDDKDLEECTLEAAFIS